MFKFCLLFLLPFSLILGEIREVSGWKPMQTLLADTHPETWVLFDVDEVLITASDAIFHAAHYETFKEIRDELVPQLSPEELKETTGILLSSREASIIDSAVLDTLRLIEGKNLKAFALTHCGTGEFGTIDSMEEWRIRELKEFGIDFHHLSQEGKVHWFEDIQTKIGRPLLKQGILFACDLDKGEVLLLTLDVLNQQPKKIIFIDDKRENVEAVERACKEREIEFIGLHYVGGKPTPLLDEKWARFQFEMLIKEKRWIPDREKDRLFTPIGRNV